ncbi:hypothetical protein [Clostridium sp. UBA1056]|uniref:hypothetical protein n=1 Tax=Clostridium sp. UBA1056 TaxID=1946346 RepID=UPI0039C8A9A7
MLLGNKEEIRNPSEIIIFNLTGISIQDNTLAALIYNKALSMGIGSKIKLL